MCGGSVGCGACAAVLYPLLDSEETMISTKAVGKKVSSSQCEKKESFLELSWLLTT